METKNVLGLDLGTNSIGWALIKLPADYKDYGKEGAILGLGSRILPDSDYKKAFETGQTNSPNIHTPAANRRIKRGARRLKHRYKLRRTRLIKVFKALGWLDENFPEDFKKEKQINENFKFSLNNYLPFSEQTVREFYKEFGYSDDSINKIIEEIDFRKNNNGKNKYDDIKLLPEDWIVYYLRKKALTEKIEFSELARIIYMLNQRRGFKSSRKDLKDSHILPYDEFIKRKDNKDFGEDGLETRFVSITKVVDIVQLSDEKDKKGNYKFKVTVDDKRIDCEQYIIERKKMPEWKGKELTLIVTQKVDKKGKFIQLQPKAPESENDWTLCTTALDEKIELATYPGKYFYEELLKAHKEKRHFKIRQYPVYRWRYQQELEAIWKKQCEINSELYKLNKDKETLKKLAETLYPTQAKNNLPKLKEFLDNDLLHIISNDIIYYQRELKSQKNSISECRYEKHIGIEKDDKGNYIKTGVYGLKCVPKSSPLFQEFRIWQDIHNIRILKREEVIDNKTKLDVDYSNKYITDEVKVKLFELFNEKTSISELDILKLIAESHPENDIVISKKKETPHSHRINLFTNRESLKGNETKARYKSVFKKFNFDGDYILNEHELLQKLWHIDYSISSSDAEKSEKGIMNALGWIKENDQWKQTEKWDEFKMPFDVAMAITKLPEIKKEYGSYSAKAIKKILPLMRVGEYWKKENLKQEVQQRIQKIIDGEFDENINNETRNKVNRWEKENRPLNFIEDFYGLPTWLACYVVYGVHSENEIRECKNSDEFNNEVILKLKNNSLRNPVVEQVIRETLLVVRDLWKQLETTNEKIDEIHIELGRELKNNTEEKRKIAEAQEENFKEKQKIKALLKELINDGFSQYNENEEIEHTNFSVKPNPNNPTDIDKFRIWKSLSKYSDTDWEKKVKDEKIPTDEQVKKYILWLSQNCRSPYTGKIIPLSKLFDETEYQKEHIIPRSKMKNDSMNNLVISEAAINPEPYKGNRLARNFIAEFGGKEYEINGKKYRILSEEEYEKHVKETFKYNKAKLNNLLATEVPENFVERQLNDTRYITKKVAHLLKPVVGSDTKIIFTGGAITSDLRKNWGLTKEWKKLMKPRFERLENITGKKFIQSNEHDRNEIDFKVPENENLDIKRIDHRHHALDALVIAATTREHIRYLNSLNAVDTNEELKMVQHSLVKSKIRDFKLPWETFTKEAREKLEETIVSFKVNNRIITNPRNLYTKWKIDNGKLTKVKIEQEPSKRWMAIRKSLFKEPLGVIYLKKIREVSLLDAFRIEIERMQIEHDVEARKYAPYIYDKAVRLVIKQIIHQCHASINEKDALTSEIKNYLKKNLKKIETEEVDKKGKLKHKTVYMLEGISFEKITIAEFVSYKTKRMPLNKKEYVEKLNLKKMKNDFPYFDFIGMEQFENFDSDKQKQILESGIKPTISEEQFKNLDPDKQKQLSDIGIQIFSKTKKMGPVNLLLLTHILEYNNDPKEAFSVEGLDNLNKKALACIGKEIKTVTRLDGEVDREDMFNGGFYETDKGAMAYFVIYENEHTKERDEFISIPTHKAIEKIIQGKPIAVDKDGYRKIILSPGDLVYVPTEEELKKIKAGYKINEAIDITNKNKMEKRTYKVVSFTGKELMCIKASIAEAIIPTNIKNKVMGEIYWYNKSPKTMEDDVVIKEICIKLKVDRLGNILRLDY
ncbi:MAG: hypothetical protein OHK0036_11130 [Bacteroidia bacterium]